MLLTANIFPSFFNEMQTSIVSASYPASSSRYPLKVTPAILTNCCLHRQYVSTIPLNLPCCRKVAQWWQVISVWRRRHSPLPVHLHLQRSPQRALRPLPLPACPGPVPACPGVPGPRPHQPSLSAPAWSSYTNSRVAVSNLVAVIRRFDRVLTETFPRLDDLT